MENAGGRWPGSSRRDLRSAPGRKLLVVCGLGNNGGDGLVAARLLAGTGSVRVLLLGPAGAIKTTTAARNWELLGPEVERAEAPDEASLLGHGRLVRLGRRSPRFHPGDRGQGRGEGAHGLGDSHDQRLAGASKVAVDIPSGLDPLTGEAGSATVRADLTVALHRAKAGLRGKGEYTGEVVVAPIGIIE